MGGLLGVGQDEGGGEWLPSEVLRSETAKRECSVARRVCRTQE